LLAVDFRTLAPGTLQTCGADADGKAYCWGGAAGLNYGQLGNGTFAPSSEPVRVAGNLLLRQLTTSRANSYMAGHSCGLDAEGRAYCWGLARYGQLGAAPAQSPNRCIWQEPNVDMPCNPRPVTVAGNQRFITIVAGNESTCAMTEDVRVYCWGYGGFGIIGRGDLDDRSEPTEIGTPTNPTISDKLTIVLPRVQLVVGDSIIATVITKGADGSTVPDGIFAWQSSDDSKVSIGTLPLPQLESKRRVILRAHSPGSVFIEVNGLGLRTWVDLVVNN